MVASKQKPKLSAEQVKFPKGRVTAYGVGRLRARGIEALRGHIELNKIGVPYFWPDENDESEGLGMLRLNKDVFLNRGEALKQARAALKHEATALRKRAADLARLSRELR
jgi:hypothetical protein